MLARHFISKASPLHPGISDEALQKLNCYHWLGNIRELENCIEYALVLAADAQIRSEHLPGHLLQDPVNSLESIRRDLPTQKEMEKRYIEMVLRLTNNNKKEAARILDISHQTLWRRLKTYR